jgi:hypothetical protein
MQHGHMPRQTLRGTAPQGPDEWLRNRLRPRSALPLDGRWRCFALVGLPAVRPPRLALMYLARSWRVNVFILAALTANRFGSSSISAAQARASRSAALSLSSPSTNLAARRIRCERGMASAAAVTSLLPTSATFGTPPAGVNADAIHHAPIVNPRVNRSECVVRRGPAADLHRLSSHRRFPQLRRLHALPLGLPASTQSVAATTLPVRSGRAACWPSGSGRRWCRRLARVDGVDTLAGLVHLDLTRSLHLRFRLPLPFRPRFHVRLGVDCLQLRRLRVSLQRIRHGVTAERGLHDSLRPFFGKSPPKPLRPLRPKRGPHRFLIVRSDAERPRLAGDVAAERPARRQPSEFCRASHRLCGTPECTRTHR